MFDNLIENSSNEMINELKKLITFPSISEEDSNSIYPFGENCNNVLNYFLELASKMGFKTQNVDRYCGYVEFGEGKDLVGLIGHLDVVPALNEDGWTTPPFSPDIRDGKLYGRGSIDDKGPVIATLYAMKAIMDSAKINKRVRLIVGLNEEKSWKCINYYKVHEEHPTIGFSPDANFPAIYAEKGIETIVLEKEIKINGYEIINFSTKNNAINVVPKYASITLKDLNKINQVFPKEENIKVTKSNDEILIESFGIASHASLPQFGKNAIKTLIEYLVKNFVFTNNYLSYLLENGFFDIESPKFLSDNKIEDQTGVLTSNVGQIEYNNNILTLKTNLRVPVSYKLDEILDKYLILKNHFSNIKIYSSGKQEPLYMDPESKIVKELLNIFNKKTNMNEKPIAIGGGTYARAFPNFISYGATFPGKKDMCHQVDEFIDLNEFILTSKIYAEAIYFLSK